METGTSWHSKHFCMQVVWPTANEKFRLGQHAQIMASFAQFLIDRIKKNDYDGPLTRLILEVRIYFHLLYVSC